MYIYHMLFLLEIFSKKIDAEQTQKIMNLIESGKTEGARCVTGGGRVTGKGFFVQPTVFADVTDNMRIG